MFFFVLQALAAAYAYNVNYREYMEKIKSSLFEIAIALGKKCVSEEYYTQKQIFSV